VATIQYALDRIGMERPSWQTLVISATRDVELPPGRLWATWADLESWPRWSPLHEAARWTGTPGWVAGATFEQTLQLGFPVGRGVYAVTVRAAEPGHLVSWWEAEGSVRSCHIWLFDALSPERTRVTDTEVFEGLATGLLKPVLRPRWQRLFERAIDGVARAAASSDNPRTPPS
jgi:hypothetical protein